MKHLWLALAMLPVTLAPGGRAAAQTSGTPPGKAFTYKHSGGQPQELEVYFPEGLDPARGKAPGLLLFHGGGWSGGNLSQFRTACQYFASRGVVALTANYRMLSKPEAAALPPGQSRKRVCITDAKSAIRWVKQHAGELGVDPGRLIVGGGSAGGHIAVLATTNPGLDDPADPTGIDTAVVAYVLFNPAFSPDDATDAEVDVLRHLKPGLPPAIVFFGTRDTWKAGWDVAYARLRDLGNTTTGMQLAAGQRHSFFNRNPWQTLTLIAADRFLVQQGLLQGEPTLVPPAGDATLTPAPAPAASPE